MTSLRKQLFAARDAHRGAAYPGDLAADVVGDARVGWRRGAAILAGTGIAALAAAAAIAMFVMLHAPEAPRQLSVNMPPAATAPAGEQVGEQTNATATTAQ